MTTHGVANSQTRLSAHNLPGIGIVLGSNARPLSLVDFPVQLVEPAASGPAHVPPQA